MTVSEATTPPIEWEDFGVCQVAFFGSQPNEWQVVDDPTTSPRYVVSRCCDCHEGVNLYDSDSLEDCIELLRCLGVA